MRCSHDDQAENRLDCGLPNIDIQKTCRENSTALLGLTEKSQARLGFVHKRRAGGARAAHQGLGELSGACQVDVHQSKGVPTRLCRVAIVHGMTRHVIKLRQEQTASTPADTHAGAQSSRRRTGSNSRECPVVKTADDGSIEWVINC
jgi:hypothetical protein